MAKFDCSIFFVQDEATVYKGGGFRKRKEAEAVAVFSSGKGLIVPSILFLVKGRPVVEIPGRMACREPKDFVRAYRIIKHFCPGILLIWRVYN